MKDIIEFFKNKKILIWGFGKEGRSTYNFIRKYLGNIEIDICDMNKIDLTSLVNVNFIESNEIYNVINNYGIIMKSPSIVIDTNIPNIFSQTFIFMKYYHSRVIGITGTKGKSTTSTLLYHILKSAHKDVLLVGNIGYACFDYIEDIKDETIIIFELSCHQLEYINHSPHIAALTNIYEDHLDHYKTFDNYIKTKYNIFKYQNDNDILIINKECKNIAKNKNVVTISYEDADITVKNSFVLINDKKVITDKDTELLGIHNLFNISIVYYISHNLLNVPDNEFKKALLSYKSLPHRLEYIGTFKDISYYNDSISTTCESTISAINSLKNIGTILLGGMDRGIHYEKLVDHIVQSDIKNIILMPATALRLEKLFKERNKKVIISSGLEDAVKIAKIHTPKGKVCILSPAAASYGFFRNFEERGYEFQRLVKEAN